jgi:hypothetical protein
MEKQTQVSFLIFYIILICINENQMLFEVWVKNV